jgi:hypothetical protein
VETETNPFEQMARAGKVTKLANVVHALCRAKAREHAGDSLTDYRAYLTDYRTYQGAALGRTLAMLRGENGKHERMVVERDLLKAAKITRASDETLRLLVERLETDYAALAGDPCDDLFAGLPAQPPLDEIERDLRGLA